MPIPPPSPTRTDDASESGARVSVTKAAAHVDEPGPSRISIEIPISVDAVAVAETAPSARGESERSVLDDLGVPPGTLVGDAYRILRPLGAGGMGVVALARDERLDRLVAVKLVRPELFAHDDLRELFAVEARAMARVTHPNVVVVHTCGEHGDVPYFVMEYVEGRTVEAWLDEQIARAGFPDLDEALRIFEGACLGVDAIHAAKAVHRDLKPSNLLMDASLRVAVSDLGVARILEDPQARGGVSCIVGSALYMSPEAALGDELPPDLATRRDIYALGCIAYELLTGRPPFDASTDMGLMAKHLLETAPPPSEARPGLSRAFDAPIRRALDKDPNRRYATAGELFRALERAKSGLAEPERILIADDDPDWRSLLEHALASRFPDAAIDVVANGEEAILAFERRPYSVCLVDLEMPEVDGMKLTGHLRSLADARETPILVLTAAGGPGEWRRLSQIGADAFLVKPVDPEDVAATIRRTLRKRHAA